MEQFLALAKNARGGSAVALIQQVLAQPGVFVFGELLEIPSIAALADSADHSAYYTLLKVFAYGTYADYKAHSPLLPELAPPQLQKLRFLSIVSLAATTKQIKYSDLLQQLDIPNVRQLEDLIIQAIYADVVRGKLDQERSILHVEFAIGRDITPESMSTMFATLTKWNAQCDLALKSIVTCMEQASKDRHSFLQEKEAHGRAVEHATKRVASAPDTEFANGSADLPTAKRQKGKR